MEPYQYKWVQTEHLSGLIWFFFKKGIMEISKFFVGRGKKGQGVFLPLCFRAPEGVEKPYLER